MITLEVAFIVGAFLLDVLTFFVPDNPLRVTRELAASTAKIWIHVSLSGFTFAVGVVAIISGANSYRTFGGMSAISAGLAMVVYSGYVIYEGLRRLNLRRRLSLSHHRSGQ